MKGLMWKLAVGLVVVILVSGPNFSWAQEECCPLLKKGTKEFSIGSGFGASFSSNTNVNFVPLNLRYGAVLTDPIGSSFWKGNFEVLGEATYDYIFHNQRKFGVSLAALFRYNFLMSECFVPFCQIGGGVYHSNVKMDDFPNDFNFLTQAGFGFNLFVRPNLALQADYRVQHLSNAGFYEENAGMNMQRGGVGIAYFF